jgi:hypothetical protein
LTDKPLDLVEEQAERFFQALGYRRSGEGDARSLEFVRGRPYASLHRASLKRCRSRVTVEHSEEVLTVRHKVEVLGRMFVGRIDREMLDAEAFCFHNFLESEELALDMGPLLRVHGRAEGTARQRAALVVVIVVLAAVGISIWRVMRQSARKREAARAAISLHLEAPQTPQTAPLQTSKPT